MKFLNVDGLFSLPDDFDIKEGKLSDYLRAVADELDKRPPGKDSYDEQDTEEEKKLVVEENNQHEKYFNLLWNRFFKTVKKGVHKNCFRWQVGEYDGSECFTRTDYE